MGFWDFLEYFKPKETGTTAGAVDTKPLVINVPPQIYYKELAIYTATSLIGDALARSEIEVFKDGKKSVDKDYYLLNVSPNANDISSLFWHKVVNQMIGNKRGALVVEENNCLYCADSFVLEKEYPMIGNTYSGVKLGPLVLAKKYKAQDVYLFRMNDVNVSMLIDGLYNDYQELFAAACKEFKRGKGTKYKLHIGSVQAGDKRFNEYFEKVITQQLKNYMSKDDGAVYPEFDGYDLQKDPNDRSSTSADVLALKKDMFSTVAGALHIPESMMTGTNTNVNDVVKSFLTLAVDPFADAITEGLNKRGGPENYIQGNRYKVNTSCILHRDLFDVADKVEKLISSGVLCIDETREELGKEPLNEKWSRQHFITKNFDTVENALMVVKEEGGEGNA